jgi:hypothetical protein
MYERVGSDEQCRVQHAQRVPSNRTQVGVASNPTCHIKHHRSKVLQPTFAYSPYTSFTVASAWPTRWHWSGPCVKCVRVRWPKSVAHRKRVDRCMCAGWIRHGHRAIARRRRQKHRWADVHTYWRTYSTILAYQLIATLSEKGKWRKYKLWVFADQSRINIDWAIKKQEKCDTNTTKIFIKT